MGTRGTGKGKHVIYKNFTKDQYIDHLTRLFHNNKWTHINFEDTQIRLVNTNGLIDNDVLWVELKQHWNSAGYSDVGYLALQINMVKPADMSSEQGSYINVRTWTPEFVDIDELMRRFPIGEFE